MNRAKAEFFDSQAEASWAAEEYGPEEAPKLARLLAEAQLRPGQSILEPGCGVGRLSQILGELVGPQGRVLALDISQGMIQACGRRVEGLGQVEAVCAALEELSEPPGGFDRVICHQVFPHFDDQSRALAKMAALLKPGGLLLVAHFVSAAEINDTHRKAGTVVENDLLPEDPRMMGLMAKAGFVVERLVDDELGYFLKARLPWQGGAENGGMHVAPGTD